MTAIPAAHTADPEGNLLALVEDLGERRHERRAVHIHLSRLRAHNRRSHHLRIAAMTFTSLAQSVEGQIFALSNADLVFVCKSGPREEIEEIVEKVRYLFNDDPLVQNDSSSQSSFCSWYHLANDFDAFLTTVRDLSNAARDERDATAANPKAGLVPITPKALAKIEVSLRSVDISSLLRRQPICAVLPGRPKPEPIFTELYVSIADLQEAIAPNVDLLADRWLFQYLTQTLDKRVLSHLTRERTTEFRGALSININMATLLSPEFIEFDSHLSAAECGTIAIELQSFDIIADMGSFHFICDYLRDRGYRLCFDGLTHLTLQYIDRQRMGMDLLKVRWSTDMADYLARGYLEELKELVARAGEGRIILCHSDSQEAISFGHAMGISLFQGRHVDALLSGRSSAAVAKAS